MSLFGMATEHPEHGPVHWLVGQSTGAEQGFVVLALTAGEDEGPHGLHTASAADLSEALMQLAPELAAPVETEPLRA
ncbi:hypothetical protein N177_0348 [Lutibaculum baratangense AMV1]|uniref:Uncharacterized protein n=1 Tax=Lutibaculum baratangense AMV1 TaxID=631454 RepID=V4RVL2_9HYPH|nr:hypothetical protein N177_0348 [Lutibaculum baratangense AMV1]